MPKKLLPKQQVELFAILQTRFEKNTKRHKGIEWKAVQTKLEANSEILSSLFEMEASGGEPDVVDYNTKNNTFTFFDCSPESPSARRSCCFDDEALEARKANKPKFSAMGLAKSMGVTILNETQYRQLQSFGEFDSKTSSWIQTPKDIRVLGGAVFCDYRFGRVFTYHNGAESYYAGRGFRAMLVV